MMADYGMAADKIRIKNQEEDQAFILCQIKPHLETNMEKHCYIKYNLNRKKKLKIFGMKKSN